MLFAATCTNTAVAGHMGLGICQVCNRCKEKARMKAQLMRRDARIVLVSSCQPAWHSSLLRGVCCGALSVFAGIIKRDFEKNNVQF